MKTNMDKKNGFVIVVFVWHNKNGRTYDAIRSAGCRLIETGIFDLLKTKYGLRIKPFGPGLRPAPGPESGTYFLHNRYGHKAFRLCKKDCAADC